MHTMIGSITENWSVHSSSNTDISSQALLILYHGKFNRYINNLDNNTRHTIRNNKQLNDMYDLLLDYVIDSAEQLNKNIEHSQGSCTIVTWNSHLRSTSLVAGAKYS